MNELPSYTSSFYYPTESLCLENRVKLLVEAHTMCTNSVIKEDLANKIVELIKQIM